MKYLICIMFFFLLFGCSNLFATPLEKELDVFKVENIPFEECILELSRISNVSISVEEVFSSNGTRDMVSLVLKNTSLNHILDEIVKLFPDYSWSFDKETNIINIFPNQKAPLGWTVDISIEDETLKNILYEEDLLELEKHNISVEVKHIIGFVLDETSTYSLEIENVPVRLAINKLCSKLNYKGNKARWSLLPKVSSLDGKTYYILLIHEVISIQPL